VAEKFSLYLKKINLTNSHLSIPNLRKAIGDSYSIEKGFGFIETDVYDTDIYSTLIYETSYNTKFYNIDTNRFDNLKRVAYEQVSFAIDSNRLLLLSFSGGVKLQKVMFYLSAIFFQQVEFDDVVFDLANFVDNLRRFNLPYTINGFIVNNFRSEVGIIGKYIAKVNNQGVARKLIDSYPRDIVGLDITVNINGFKNWYIFSNGKVVLKQVESWQISQDIDILKDVVFREN
jgi:hypothetical protein